MYGTPAPLLITNDGNLSQRLKKCLGSETHPMSVYGWSEALTLTDQIMGLHVLLHNPPISLPERLLDLAENAIVLLDQPDAELELNLHQHGLIHIWSGASHANFPQLLKHKLSQLGLLKRPSSSSLYTDIPQLVADFESVQHSAHLGIWSWDRQSNQVYWSEETYTTFGQFSKRYTPQPNSFALLAIEEDRQTITQTFEEAWQKPGQTFEVELRLQVGDIWTKVIKCTIHSQAQPGQAAYRLFGTVQNITMLRSMADALSRSEERLNLALEGAQEGLWDWEISSGALYFSARWERMLGYDPGEIPHTYDHWVAHIHKEDLQPTQWALDEHLRGLSPHIEIEHRLQTKKGTWVWLLTRGKVVSRDHNHTPLRVVGTQMDISARKRAEQALKDAHTQLKQQGQLFRNYFDWGVVGMAISTPDRLWLHANPHLCSILKCQPKALINTPMDPWFDAQQRDHYFLKHERLIRDLSDGFEMELPLRTSDGKQVAVNLSTRALRDETGHITHCIHTIQDLTLHAQALQQVQESEKRFRAIFEHAGLAVAQGDIHGRILKANSAYARMLDFSPEALVGRDLESMTHPDDLLINQKLLQELIAKQRSTYTLEKRLICKDGTAIWVEMTVTALTNAQDEPESIIGMAHDITDRRTATEALKESEQRYRQLFQRNKAVELLIDPSDGSIVDANEAAENFYGYTRDLLRNMRIMQINTLTKAQVQEEMQRAEQEKRNHFQFRHRLASGEIRDVEVHSGPVLIQGRELLYSIVHDTTERRRIEEALAHNRHQLEASHTRLLTILDGLQSVVYVADPHTQDILYQNRYLFEIAGNLKGQKDHILYIQHDRKHIDEQLKQKEEPLNWEYRSPINHRWYSAQSRYISWVDGRNVRLEVATDISSLKQSQEALFQAKESAERANRAKSDFLATMSHDIRTPMNAVLGMVELLSESDLDVEQSHYLEAISRAGSTLLSLINDILDLSKIEAGQLSLELANFPLAEPIEQVINILSYQAQDKGLKLLSHSHITSNIQVRGDAQRLRQILLNLVGNAVKFTVQGTVTLTLTQLQDGTFHFCIRDTGPGIASDRLETIFDPFVQEDAQIHRTFGGSGLGLSICQKLVAAMQGHLWVESTLEQGSSFYFTLPLPHALTTAGPVKAHQHALQPLRHSIEDLAGKSLLVVDDAEDNRNLIRAYLKKSGMLISMAENGLQAVELCKKQTFDLILMDIQMPIMNGLQATTAIRAKEQEQATPPTPIIALTAHAMRDVRDDALKAGCNLHLSKPIAKARLVEILLKQLCHGPT
ncbi:PAS domain S-box protein [Magnetococcus sp. PR-3]|uniref:PAS domain S-box protein n=1 Tax=Magnetococcus sp. PR-3 TaxID=3120355 RepID=UPI002FCE4E16